MKRAHAMPFGASVLNAGGVRFAPWAPGLNQVMLERGPADSAASYPMVRAADGWHRLEVPKALACDGYHADNANAPLARFFCDFGPELTQAVTEGRRREFVHFAAFSDEAACARIPDPGSASTFEASKLRWSEHEQGVHGERLAGEVIYCYGARDAADGNLMIEPGAVHVLIQSADA